MKKILPSFMLILLTFSINGCLKREMIVTPQQQSNQNIIIPTPSIEEPIKQNTVISTPSIDVTPTREIVTAPPIATNGALHQLKTVQGTTIAVQERSNGLLFPQYPNKIILLQVFGQHCPYCLDEMPTLQRIQQQYAGNLQIIALQAQEPMSPSTASMLIQQYQMHYPVIDKEEAIDLLFFLQQTFEWTGILPYTLLIKNGVTEYPFFGPVTYQELNESIQSLL